MTRRSRLDRLNFAKWAPAKLAISPVDWTELEKALGRELTAEQRGEISEIAGAYAAGEGMERAAPFVRDEAEWFRDFQKVAGELHRLTVEVPARSRAARSGVIEVQLKLDALLIAVCGQSFSIEQIALFLGPAISKAKDRRRPPGIEEGAHWRNLVRALDAKFGEFGLPTGIRKDSDKSKSGAPSPFVAFLFRLQRCFPPEARRYDQSVAAVAAAMAEARRENIRAKAES